MTAVTCSCNCATPERPLLAATAPSPRLERLSGSASTLGPALPRAHSSQRSSLVSPGPSPCFLEVWSGAIRRVRSSTPAKALTQQRTRGSPQQLAQLLPPTSDRRPRQGDPRTNLSRWAKPSLALISPRRRCTPSRRSKVRRKPTSRFGPIAQRSRRAAPGARS